MLNDTSAVRNYFTKLGLEVEIADIYLSLHSNGPQSISELARTSHVERTHIYRLIDTLLESNLIELETHSKRGVIKAAPIANLRILITQKEQDLRSLQDELELIEQVLARNSLSSPVSRVQFYYGSHGIKQMLRNELDAKTEILGYGYRTLEEEAAGKTFMNTWAETFKQKKLKCRLITNDDFVQSEHEGQNTSVNAGTFAADTQLRTTKPEDFTVTHTCSIYNDIVSTYHWKNGEIYGIETHNVEIAAAQKQLFELLWQKSYSKI